VLDFINIQMTTSGKHEVNCKSKRVTQSSKERLCDSANSYSNRNWDIGDYCSDIPRTACTKPHQYQRGRGEEVEVKSVCNSSSIAYRA